MSTVGLPAILLTIACLLVCVTAVQPVARRLMLPETVLLALLGIAIGGGADAVLTSPNIHLFDKAARVLVDLPISSETVLLVFLPILVFAGALSIDVRRLSHDAAAVLVLAIVAVVVSTAAIGVVLWQADGASLVACLMLGAIVATTDPSAVSAIFGEIGASSRLTRLVEGEALLNDAAAISIFSLLLAALVSHHAIHAGGAVLAFARSFGLALLVGVALGRATLALVTSLGETVAGEVTLTLALPFIAYIVSDHFLGLSGVVAVAASGLTISAYGPSTMRPQTWRFLTELWDQLAFWAGSLVFVLASMLVPRLLLGATWRDLSLVLLTVVAALLARTAVLFGILPVLERTGLARAVPRAYKLTIVWGGLRGAITLALALSVTENPGVSASDAHFVAVVATGFVLFTLLVNGTTLRSLVVILGLDRLSARDEALRHQVIAIALSEVRDRARRLAGDLGFSPSATRHAVDDLEKRIGQETTANDFDSSVGDRDRIVLALITIASRERTMLVESFRFRGLTRGVTRRLLRTADAMVDGARSDGRVGYLRAVRKRLRPGLSFRLAQLIHRLLRIERPLMRQMTIRYEMLLVGHLLAMALERFLRRRVDPVLGPRVAEIVSDVLERRQRLLGDALEALRLHYPGYAEALESRVVRQTMLRIESEEYDGLLAESLIGEELHRELSRSLETRRRRLERPLRFNLQAGVDRRVPAFPLFAALPEAIQHDLAMVLSIRFAVPGEVLVRRGRRPSSVILVSSGTLEYRIGETETILQEGDEIGGREVLDRARMQGTLRCTSFSHLLVVGARAFRRLVAEYPAILDELGRTPALAAIEGPTVVPPERRLGVDG